MSDTSKTEPTNSWENVSIAVGKYPPHTQYTVVTNNIQSDTEPNDAEESESDPVASPEKQTVPEPVQPDPISDELLKTGGLFDICRVRVGIIGAVSTGKSTLLNSLYKTNYSKTRLQRTTMLPQVYQESRSHCDQPEDIQLKNDMTNQQYQTTTTLTASTLQPVIHQVAKMTDAFKCDLPIDLVDIPGLDDGETEALYFKYLEDTIETLDVIVLMVDIKESFNTSGSRNILDQIISGVAKYPDKQFSLLVVVNKCDELELAEDGSLMIVDEEYNELFLQVMEVIQQKTKSSRNISWSASPLSAEDSYIYRSARNNPNIQFSQTQLNRLGMQEMGKKWKRLSEEKQREWLRTGLEQGDYDERMTLSGFSDMCRNFGKLTESQRQTEWITYRVKKWLGKADGASVFNVEDLAGTSVKSNLPLIHARAGKLYYKTLLEMCAGSSLVDTREMIKQHLLDEFDVLWEATVRELSIEPPKYFKSQNQPRCCIIPNDTQLKLSNEYRTQLEATKQEFQKSALTQHTDILSCIGDSASKFIDIITQAQNTYYKKNILEIYDLDRFVDALQCMRDNQISTDEIHLIIDKMLDMTPPETPHLMSHKIPPLDISIMELYAYLPNIYANKESPVMRFCDSVVKRFAYPMGKIFVFYKEYIYTKNTFGGRRREQAKRFSTIESYPLLRYGIDPDTKFDTAASLGVYGNSDTPSSWEEESGEYNEEKLRASYHVILKQTLKKMDTRHYNQEFQNFLEILDIKNSSCGDQGWEQYDRNPVTQLKSSELIFGYRDVILAEFTYLLDIYRQTNI